MPRYIDADLLVKELTTATDGTRIHEVDCDNFPITVSLRDLKRLIRKMRTANVVPRAEVEELSYKLECLLCYSTGGKLSKTSYSLKTMECAVTDYINDCCYETNTETKAEAIKEFAKKLTSKFNCIPQHHFTLASVLFDLDNLVKEMTD